MMSNASRNRDKREHNLRMQRDRRRVTSSRTLRRQRWHVPLFNAEEVEAIAERLRAEGIELPEAQSEGELPRKERAAAGGVA